MNWLELMVHFANICLPVIIGLLLALRLNWVSLSARIIGTMRPHIYTTERKLALRLKLKMAMCMCRWLKNYSGVGNTNEQALLDING